MDQMEALRESVSALEIKPTFSHDYLIKLIAQNYRHHPFTDLALDNASLKFMLAEYLAMSTAFPYLQAGSCATNIITAIKENHPINRETELTSVVGSFLVWDELGGWFKTSQRGVRGLPDILDTRAIHANILKSDLSMLFGEEVQAHFGPSTQGYLLALYERLSDSSDILRCATMTSFELHAERMITELWNSLHRLMGVEKKQLRYFMSHVGGADPAEAYHVKMTESLIALVASRREKEFEEAFLDGYGLHLRWCQTISHDIPRA